MDMICSRIYGVQKPFAKFARFAGSVFDTAALRCVKEHWLISQTS